MASERDFGPKRSCPQCGEMGRGEQETCPRCGIRFEPVSADSEDPVVDEDWVDRLRETYD